MKAGLLVVALLAVAACGDTDGTSSPTSPDGTSTSTVVTAAPDDGDDGDDGGDAPDPSGAWVLVDGPVEPIPGWDVTVTIEGGQIGGTAACNGYGGTVTWTEAGDMTVGDLGATDMGCEPAVHELEQAFLSVLQAVTAFEASGDRLALVGPDGTWRFERLAEVPTAELVGTTWVVDGYVDGETVSNEVGMEHAFVELSGDGTLVGATNCRTLSGTWVVSGAEVVFTSFAADGDCPLEQLDLDGRILTVLGDGFRPVIDGDRMTATSQGGEALTFRAGDRPTPPEPPAGDTAPDPAGGVDGPVMYWRQEDVVAAEDALIGGRLVLGGECLYVDHPEWGRYPVLWMFGTTWQIEPAGIVLPTGEFVALGETVTTGGGYYATDGTDSPSNAHLSRFTKSTEVADLASQCALGEFREIAVVQHTGVDIG